MKKSQISQEHKLLIESVIKKIPNYKGNEDLLELCVESAYKKSYLIIDAIKDTERLKRHLFTICESSIEQLIREKQKFNYQNSNNTKKKADVVSVRKSPLYDNQNVEEELVMKKTSNNLVNLKEEIQRSERYDSVDFLIDPLDFCPKKRVTERTLEKLIKIIKQIDEQFPKKRYFEIFSFRYFKRYNQTDTAREMKISQVELSKRFIELVKLTRDRL